jgi:hypothetical protein
MTPGHGIAGMRERAEALGGRLTAGASSGGGFSGDREPAGDIGSTAMRSVVVVDDEHLVRSGFAALLASAPEITVVGTAEVSHRQCKK